MTNSYLTNFVITKACVVSYNGAKETLILGHVLVQPVAALLAAVTAAGGTYRMSANPAVNDREPGARAFGMCSNASA